MTFSITVKEAADQLGVSVGRIHQLIKSGALAAEKLGKQWIIDDQSVIARTALKPQAGRPSAQIDEAARGYILMNRTHEVLRFSYSLQEDHFIAIEEIIDGSRAPLGIVSPRGAAGSTTALAAWWHHRSIPASRKDIDEKLRQLGFQDPAQIPFKSLGLSLSDQYWVRPVEAMINWEDLNYFNNAFPDMDMNPEAIAGDWLKEVGLDSPDNTSDGMLSKRWIRQGSPMLIKGGSSLNQEPYNEVVATALYRRVLAPHEYVSYELVDTPAGAVSCCADFLSDVEEYIPAYYVNQLKRKPNHFSAYQHYIDCCASVGVDDAAQVLSRMIVCDDILANHDRHWRNFGLIRNVETLKYRSAPLFDSGSSLWCNASESALLNGNMEFKTKPFYEDANRQLRLADDLTWFDPAALEGFVDEVRAILAGNPALGRRLDAICEGIQWRIDRLIRLL